MSRLKPKKFDKCLLSNLEWHSNCLNPNDWHNIKFITSLGDYYLYYAYQNDGEEFGQIYVTKIENVKEDKEEEDKTNIIRIGDKKYKLVEVEE